VVGEAAEGYPKGVLDRWTRRIIFLKPHSVIIHDVLEAPEPSTYQWLLHANGPFDIGEEEIGWTGDGGSLAIRFLHAPQLNVTQKNAYDTPLHDWATFDLDEWHLTATTTETSAAADFITHIAIDGARPAIEMAQDGEAWRIGVGEAAGAPAATISLGKDSFSVR